MVTWSGQLNVQLSTNHMRILVLFSILWKMMMDYMNKKDKKTGDNKKE